MESPQNYYEQDRSELLVLMPSISGSKVLDVGCAAGGLGRLLKEKGCGQVYGIEPVSDVADKAAQFYDKVYKEDIETFTLPLPNCFFDIIVCADVLEHLKNPWAVLKKLKNHLKTGGSLIASIPNIRCGKVIGRLLRGEFGYDSEGILDKTHLRFFTFNGIIKLLAENGFKVVEVVPTYYSEADVQIPRWKQLGVPAKIQEMVKILSGIDFSLRDDELIDFFTFQFLVRAEPIYTKVEA